MTSIRLLITAMVVENRPVRVVAETYGVSKSWLYELRARYRDEGDAAFEHRSRRRVSNPNETPPEIVDLIVRLRKELSEQGLDAGPETICWHLDHDHQIVVSRTTVARHLVARGMVTPEPKKRPKSSYTRFEAALPNECWQSDFPPQAGGAPATTGSPTPTAGLAPTPRSCPGSTTAPGSPCTSPPTTASPD